MASKAKTKKSPGRPLRERPNPPPVELAGQKQTFVLGERLGAGGMAEVFRGEGKSTGIQVAVKRPLASLRPEDKAIFLREAQAAERAAGPGVVRVLDWGDNPPFIAFELVSDPTLENEIENRKADKEPWTTASLLSLFSQLVSAMKIVNEHVLHRDLKPANIFVGQKGVRVSDFGLAKFADEATRSRTFKHLGSAPYIAPEAWQGDSVDWRADQYALGIVFFEMATFQRPFDGTATELEQKHLYEPAPRAESRASGLPPRVTTLIAKMLQKRREDRYTQWDDLTRDITSAAEAVAGPVLPTDPLARILVDKLGAFDRARLEAQKAQDERIQGQQQREGLANYWSRTFSDAVARRIATLNAHAGDQIRCTPSARKVEISLLNARLLMLIEPVSEAASEDIVAWGVMRTTTPKKSCVTQLILQRDPSPYGSWLEAQMEVNPIAGAVNESTLQRAGRGGGYEILGAKRLVIARDPAGLLAQRALRNVFSIVQYQEVAFDLEANLDEHLKVFIDGATTTRASDREI